MKILLDACVPRPLRNFLSDYTVKTAQEMGWGTLQNGALIKEAESQFDAFITSDQNLKYQQNITGRKLAILVLPTNDWPAIRLHGDEIATKASALQPGDFVELTWS
jgi:predicted nuclease of predicted toxin-antitoxin system